MPQYLGPVRDPADPIEQRHKNLACSLQARLEEVYLGMLSHLKRETELESVCLAGGVAFNCVANGKIPVSTGFKNVYVHPAAGDAGLAVGAAQFVWHQVLGHPREFAMAHAYWGPEFSGEEIRAVVRASRFSENGCAVYELSEEELLHKTASIIADGKILGWFQGRAEWGPRALGNRSIVADPRRPEMKEILDTTNLIALQTPYARLWIVAGFNSSGYHPCCFENDDVLLFHYSSSDRHQLKSWT